MSAPLKPFSERSVAVTLTGTQWFAILAKLTYAKEPPGLFSTMGRREYETGSKSLGDQLVKLAGSEREKLEIVR